MKLKRLLALILVIILCFSIFGCADSTSRANGDDIISSTKATEKANVDNTKKATPLLYKISDDEGNVVWLFGSIHVGKEYYYPLPDYVLEAFDNADSLAVEADIVAFEKNPGEQMDSIANLLYQDGTTIKDHIPENLYNKAVDILKKYNSYYSLLDNYKPVFWSSLIDNLQLEKLGADANLGIDKYLLDRAYESKKEVLEVESVSFQYELLGNFSDELQTFLLESSVETEEDLDPAKEDLAELMSLWASGEEEKFSKYLASTDEEMATQEKILYEEYERAMVVDRNKTMARYTAGALKTNKEIFICVGAAHVVGEGAIADILAKNGYKVECITE